MSVSFKAIIDVMENLAPLTLKEDWDNPGLACRESGTGSAIRLIDVGRNKRKCMLR